MKKLIALLIFINFIQLSFSQNDIELEDFEEKLWSKKQELLNSLKLKSLSSISNELESVDSLFSFTRYLKGVDKKLNGIQGAFKLSISGNKTQNQDLFNLTTGFQIKKGTYPSEFDFEFGFNVQSVNGELQENFSVLSASYEGI